LDGYPSGRYHCSSMGDAQYLRLLQKYRQDRPGPPWERINPMSDVELHDDLQVANALQETYGPNTLESVIGGGVIGGWIAQALMIRSWQRSGPGLFASTAACVVPCGPGEKPR
jgi:hypothetical protein